MHVTKIWNWNPKICNANERRWKQIRVSDFLADLSVLVMVEGHSTVSVFSASKSWHSSRERNHHGFYSTMKIPPKSKLRAFLSLFSWTRTNIHHCFWDFSPLPRHKVPKEVITVKKHVKPFEGNANIALIKRCLILWMAMYIKTGNNGAPSEPRSPTKNITIQLWFMHLNAGDRKKIT